MKHFLRIFSIFLAITFSLNASKSYGQTSPTTVSLTVLKDTICAGEFNQLQVTASDSISFYWQVLDGGVWQRAWFSIVYFDQGGSPKTQQPDLITSYKYRVAYVNKGRVAAPNYSLYQEFYSDTVSVYVRPSPIPGIIDPTTQNICLNSTATSIRLYNSLGSVQWYKSLTTTDADFVAINGETATSLSNISTSTIGTTYYRAVLTEGTLCPSKKTDISIVIVDAPSVSGTASIASGNATICANSATPIINVSGSLGTISWVSSSTLTGTYSAISGASSPAINNANTKYYKASVKNLSCPAALSNAVLVTVNQASNAGTITPVTQAICINGSPAAITLSGYTGTIQWQSSTSPSGSYTNMVGLTSATLPSGSISNTTTMYYQAVVTSGVCPSQTITATVNVNPTSVGGTASITAGTATICYNTAAPTITLVGNEGTVQWQWSLTSGGTYTNTTGTSTSPTVDNKLTKYYRAKVTSGVCSVDYSNEVLVTVSPASNAGTITPVTQTICYNGTPAAITLSGYTGTIQWQSSTSPSGSYTNMVGLTSATLPSGSISNTTTMYYQAVVTSGVCPSQTITATVNVNPTSVGGTASITAGTATICYNTAAPTITLVGNEGTVQWQWSLTSGGTYTNTTGTSTSPTVDNKLTKYYRAKVTSGVCSVDYSNEVLVTVSPASNAGTITPVTQAICINGSPAAITLSGYTGTIQWQSSTSPSGSYTNMVGLTSATLPSGSISNTTTMYYQAVVTSGVCPSQTITATVNVNPTSVGGTASITAGTATICYNTAAPTITLVGNEGTVQWQWSLTSGGTYTNTTGTSTSPTVDNKLTKYYRAKVTSGVCSVDYSNEVLVTVSPASNAGTITPVTQAICINGSPAAITLSGYTGTIQWQSSTSPSGSYTNMVGLTSATLPSGSISNTTTMYYQAVVTSGVCPSQTITATVNVNPTSVGGTASITAGTATICYNTAAPTITLVGNEGTVQWQWSLTSGGTYTNTTGTSTSPTVDNKLTKYYRAKVTSGVCSVDYSNEVLVTVSPASNAGTITPVTQAICINGSPAAITLSGYTGTIQWQSSTSPSGSYTNMVGLTSATLPSGSISNTTTMYYQAVVTSGVCPSQTITATVNVNPTSVGGTASITAGTATICYNTAAPTITLVGNEGTVQWQWSLTSGGTYTNTTGTSTSPTVDNKLTKYYRAKVTSGVCSVDYSNEVLVTVSPASNAGTITPVTQAICINGSPAAITLSGYTGTIQWQSSTSPSGSYTNMVGLTSATLPSGSISNTTTMYYQAVVTSGVCPSQTITATVNVNPTSVGGTASITAGTATICYNTAAPTITLVGNEGTVQWQWSLTSGGTYTNTTGTSTSPTVDNKLTKYYRAKVTSGVCSVDYSNEVLVTVSPASNAGTITPVTQAICINGSPAAITLSGYTGTIQWQSSTSPSGSYTNMVGLTSATLPSGSISNTTTMYYQAVVTSGVCPSQTITATVNVNPTSVGGTASITAGTATICYNTAAPTITLVGNEGTVQWQWSLTSGGTYTNTTGTSTSPTVDNKLTKYYRAKVTSGVCSVDYSNEVLVTVSPASNAGTITPVTQAICINGSPAAITLSGYTGTIQWQSSTSPSGSYTNMVGLTSATLPSGSISNTTTMYYQAVVTSGVCPSQTITATVNVNPTSVGGTASLAGTSTVCYGTATVSLPVITLAGNIGTIQWQSSSASGGVYTNTAGTTSPVIDNTASKYYRAIVTSGVCNADNSNEVSVTVDPTSQVGSISPLQKIQQWCIGSPATAVTLPGYVGTIQWQTAALSGNYTDMTGLINATLPSANIPTNVAGTKTYRAQVTSGVCPSIYSDVASVQVDAATVAGSIAGTSNLICNGSTPPTITLAGNLSTRIEWLSGTIAGSLTSTTPTQTGQSISSVVNNLATGNSRVTHYYQALVTNGKCNTLATNEVSVTVDPTSQVGSISPLQKIQQWCIGSPATAVTLPGYVGTIQWQTAALSGNYTDMTGLINATLPSANIPTNVAGTKTYRAQVTSGVCPSIYSDVASVQVDAATVAGSIAGTSNLICNGSTPPTITLAGNLSTRIEWLSGTIAGSLTSTTPTQTGQSISSVVNNLATGNSRVTHYYQALVTNGKCNTLATNEVSVTVDPTSQVGSISPLQKIQQWCIGSPATAVTLPGYVGTIQWQTAALSGNYTDMTGLTNATLPSANIPTNVAGTKTYRAQVTSGVCPSIYSDVASVQVDAATVAGSIAGTSNLICNGSTPPTITLAGNLSTRIEWLSGTIAGSLTSTTPTQTGQSISSVVNNLATGNSRVTHYYQALVTNGKCNTLATNEVSVTVDPTSQVGSISPLQKIQQWCIGSPATAVTLPGYVGTIQWQTAALSGNYTDMTGLTNATLPFGSIPTNVAGTLNYRAVVTSGVCPSINSEIVSVQTDAATVAGDIYYLKGSSPICNQGEKPTITIRNNTGSNIVWQITTISNSSSVIGTENSLAYANTTQTGNILNSAIDNNAPGAVSSFKYYRASVQNGVCKTEYTTALELEVIPTPVITKVVPAERCGPGIVELLAESNLGTPNWFAANTGGTAIGIGNSFTTPVLNTSTNYYVGAIFRGCVSFSRTTVLAKIKPIPTITSVTGATNCGPGILELSATATGGEINWFTDPTGGSTLLTSPKYTTPLIRVTTIYYAQALQDGCYSAPRAPVEATIFEVPVIAALPDLYSICAGLTYNIKYSASLGLPPYVFNFFTNNSNVIGQKDGYLTGVKGGITNVYFNVKDMNGCVSLNTNSFQVKTYDPVSPQRFNYQAFYKDNFLIPTKIDSGYVSYNWQPGLYLNNPDKPNPIFNGENTTDYVLIRTDTTTKCTVADNYHIDVTRDFIFDLPNAFTPNYDGLNDVIKSIKNAGIDKVTSLSIFNRYGTKVCCTLSEIENGWNGTTNGKMQDTDGYFWRATFETKDGRTLTKKGAFLLLK